MDIESIESNKQLEAVCVCKNVMEERKCADPDLALTQGPQTPNNDIGNSKSSNIKIDIEMDIKSNQIVEHRHRHRIKSQLCKL